MKTKLVRADLIIFSIALIAAIGAAYLETIGKSGKIFALICGGVIVLMIWVVPFIFKNTKFVKWLSKPLKNG